MKYGLTLPDTVDARTLGELAYQAEESGWDGIFYWDVICGNDPWIALAAAAMRTQRIRIGTMLTPVSRRRPWKLASEAMTLDQLSNGRLILPVGLGAAHPGSPFVKVGEQSDRKIRAQLLDEGLDILAGLWSGEPFSYDGEHYHIQDVTFSPTPVQSPRIPIWVVGAWPRRKSMQRVLHWDGILPTKMNDDGSFDEMTPADLQTMKAFIDERRTETTPFDIVMEGETPGDDSEQAASILHPLAEAGLTWWLEAVWHTPETLGGLEGMRARILQGPPRIDV